MNLRSMKVSVRFVPEPLTLVEVSVTFVFPNEMVMLVRLAAESSGSLTVNAMASEFWVDLTVWAAMAEMVGGAVPVVSGWNVAIVLANAYLAPFALKFGPLLAVRTMTIWLLVRYWPHGAGTETPTVWLAAVAFTKVFTRVAV